MKAKMIVCGVLLVILICSIFLVSPKMSNPETYKNTIQKLNEKQAKVLEMTGTATSASLALGAIPGDATTPIANKIIDLVGYFIIILGVIVLEKYMLTIAGYLTFTWLLPIACVLFGIFIFSELDIFRQLSLKFFLLGVSLVLIVPASVKVSDFIEKANEVSINSSMENIKELEEETAPGDKKKPGGGDETGQDEKVEEKVEEEELGGFDLLKKVRSELEELVENGQKSITETPSIISRLSEETVRKAKDAVNDFVEVVVIMLVTTCGIPILTILLFAWIVKTLLGIDFGQVAQLIKRKA